jgi:1-aminocyclopropane-1-carboxylate deaminase/D-cysteine desulfhydrase-like pyridoxal-dependent ACC family enzyme
MEHIKTTPLTHYSRISNLLNINLFVKHDDLYPVAGGGSKARKLDYILNDYVKNNYNAIVSAGGNQSNHLRTTSLYGANLGWKTVFIVHDTKPGRIEGNLKIMNLCGAEIHYVKKEDVKEAMDEAMEDLKNKGYAPLYIWGGGHCLEGSFAFYEAVKELKKQTGSMNPDYLFVASGTGTTQAGIEIAIREMYPQCQVIGVSVARQMKRGKDEVLNSMNELNSHLNNPVSIPNDIFFDDKWVGDGYEAIYPGLTETIQWAAETEGLILDPTYTGKAFHALKMYVQEERIPENSNVVFWHTGGLLNLMASNDI